MILCPISIRIEKFQGTFLFSKETQIREISKDELNNLFNVEDISFDEEDYITDFSCYRGRKDIWELVPKSLEAMIFEEDLIPPKYVIESCDDEEIRKLILAIHIISRGNFLCPIGINLSEDRTGKSTLYFYEPFNYRLDISCLLDGNDLTNIKNLFMKLLKKCTISDDPVLQRFLRCCDIDQHLTVRIIDTVGLIESIICNDLTTEISFRFSLYSSFLLNKLGVQVSFSQMKKFYDLRSSLAHSGKVGRKQQIDSEKLDEILNYTKIIMREYLDKEIDRNYIEDQLFSQLCIPRS